MKDWIKRYSWIVGLIAIAVVIIVCFQEKKEKEQQRYEIEQLCRHTIHTALEDMKGYAETGEESRYYSGVAEFRAFMQIYYGLKGETIPEYLYCNEVYGLMLNQPQKVQENVHKLIPALEALANDYTDLNGYMELRVFYNAVTI